MKKLLLACSALLLSLAAPAHAQTETFSAYVGSLPPAISPLGAGDELYLLQGGVSKALSVNAINFSAPAHQFLNAFNGAFTAAQPVAGDISGLGTIATQSANAVNITGGAITGMPAPLSASDVATKQYVDTNITGFHIHNPVVLATSAPLPTWTWTATGGGVLTATANGALSIDGVVVTVATRVLVKNELNSGTACNGNVNAACDGVYNVTQVGTGGTPFILQRASLLNSVGFAENTAAGWSGNDSVSVMGGGTLNANTVWINTMNIATLNLTPFNFFQFSSTGGGVSSISNSDGTLTITPSTGVIVASLALNHPNTFTATQTFPNGSLTNAELANASITVNGVTCTLGATCTIATTSAGRINIPASGAFFAPSAIVNNINDRVFIGGATAYNGVCCTDTGSWLGIFGLSYLGSAQAGILTDAAGNGNSSVGLTVGARSSPATSAGPAIIALFPVVINNNSTFANGAWAIYAEAWRVNSTVGQTNGIEIETRNLGNEIVSDPFLAGGFGMSATIEAGCGAGVAGGNPCPMSVLIFANNNPFDSGLVFANLSVKARSGVVHAIDLPTMYQIVWMSSANQIAGYIWVGNAGTFNIVSTDGKIDLNGTDGVTCSAGINAGTFRSLGGLVTHC